VHAYQWVRRHFPSVVDCLPIARGATLTTHGFEVVSAEIVDTVLPVEIVVARRA
jgi:hypothetical protein